MAIAGNEKAWIATGVGCATTIVSYLLSQVPADDPSLNTVRIVLLVLAGALGIPGGGIGVWMMTNSTPTPTVQLGTQTVTQGQPIATPKAVARVNSDVADGLITPSQVRSAQSPALNHEAITALAHGQDVASDAPEWNVASPIQGVTPVPNSA